MILVTFHSVSSALYLEELLKARETACKVIPVPRELSSSCGYAAEIGTADTSALEKLMNDELIEWEGIYTESPEYRLLASN